MHRLRTFFYYLTTGITLGFLLSLLLTFNTKYEMMISLALMTYIFIGFGIMLGVAFKNIRYKYIFFIIEGLTLLIALLSGKLMQIVYIVKETFFTTTPVKNIILPFIVVVAIINIINIYIITTLSKYQKVYSREELKELKAKETKLSELREKLSPEELAELKKSRKKQRNIALIIITISLIIYFAIPSVREKLNYAFATISQLDTNIVIEYLRSYGAWAAVVSFILMILQSIAAPIPAFLITLSNAAIFGWVWGAVLSWSSAMAGAALCFFLARALGRGPVEKLTSKGAMASVDVFFERYGKHTIFICRLLPFVSFDFVSYGAGLTNMKFWSFFIATGIGQLPATIVYSYVGGTLTGGAQKLFLGLMSLFALSIMIAIAKKVYNDKHKTK
ncbi:TVP38/TMEM64 family protein [Gemelliphila palaticanis]|uniref:TVP38/TMEM64 family membrane protein n=1 Tax=Gemelliphila palaticanis TaxID=81950 RepID=A0ABX2SYE7_9BACL|nr:TVP38/TMEM64 family protein [Gemella palaticanis]MBF0715358.1 TVP38/TMEM64 family protein [Gemella palaticanis]NYS47288.1 TVP38/TMEM64 family protein [Gemella palaticanis]